MVRASQGLRKSHRSSYDERVRARIVVAVCLAVGWPAACTVVADGVLEEKPLAPAGGGGEGGDVMGKPLGAPCETNDECASGSCADEVCCDKACSGPCVLCDLVNNEGTCTQHVAGTDPDDDCEDPRVCSSNGTCVALDGSDCLTPMGCDSDFCVDDVCCDTACNDVCESCRAVDTGLPDGLCAPLMPGVDPGDDCVNRGDKCVTSGLCCGESTDPDPQAPCPAICDNGCAEGTCLITCDGAECHDVLLSCPDGYNCRVDCSASSDCKKTRIHCPPTERCDVYCAEGGKRCDDLAMQCGDGPCSMTCSGGDECDHAEVFCGANTCDVVCSTGDDPRVQCGTSCGCTLGPDC